MYHFNAGQIIETPLPAGTGTITGISMVSPTEGWAVDATNDQGHAQILHYAQGAWSVAVTMTDNSTFTSITMVSATEGWATGPGEGVDNLWHYTGGHWRRVAVNDPNQTDITRISMVSATEGWAMGIYTPPHQSGDQYQRTGGAIWHYTNGQWRVVQRYTDDPLQSIRMCAIQALAANDVWVCEQDSTGLHFLHLANGAWQTLIAPQSDGVNDMVMVSSTEGWAVGYAGQILHYTNGAWRTYPTLGQ
jgi:hypothetical protein